MNTPSYQQPLEPNGTPATAPATPMNSLIARVKNILLTPQTEWQVINTESSTVAQLYTAFIIPLSAFAAVLTFVHVSVVGVSVPFAGLIRSPISAGLSSAIMGFVFGLVGVYLFGFIVNTLAPTFGGTRDQRQAMKIAAYSLAPAWVMSVLALSPVLPVLLQFLAGCYGIYILYLGLPVLMRAPRERAVGYTATVVICCIVASIVFGLIAGAVGHFGMRTGLAALSPAQHEAMEQAQREEGARVAGNILGSMLGTDEKGKAGLSNALSNLAKAGEEMEKRQAAGAASGPASSDRTAGTSNSAGTNTAGGAGSAGAANDATGDAASTRTAAAGAGGGGGGDGTAPSPAAAVGGLLSAVGSSLGGPDRVDPVNFKTLAATLPQTLAGMSRSNVKSEGQTAMGVKTTRSEADYRGADGAVHLQIADVSGVSGLLDLATGIAQSTESESDAGYEKNAVIAGHAAHEKWDARQKRGEINMIVAKRFSVDVTGNGVPMSTLEAAYRDINLSALEAMKDANRQK